MIIENKIPQNLKTEEFLQQMADLYPEPVIISTINGIVLFNDAASHLVGGNILGRSVIDFIEDEKKQREATVKLKLMLKNRIRYSSDYYKLHLNDEISFDAEVISGYVEVEGNPALFSVVRDVSIRKSELLEAIRLQKNLIEKQKPSMDGLDFDIIYEPSQSISGDFYFHHQINDHTLIGILGDVSGKGISAAMNISAFEVMFRTTVSLVPHPHDIILRLNRLANDFFNGRFIAVICYAIDLRTHTLRISSGGISEFIISSKNDGFTKHKLMGPFLGMFQDLPFDYMEFTLNPRDRLFFYTDGIELALDDDSFHASTNQSTLQSISTSLKEKIYLKEMENKHLHDDCTIISFEIKE